MSKEDTSMPLGIHLDELRTRIITILIYLVIVFFAAIGFQDNLKTIITRPLKVACSMLPKTEAFEKFTDFKNGAGKILRSDSLVESPITGFKIALIVSLFIIVPIIIREIWRFVSPALEKNEKKLAFLFVPTAAILFYSGALLGFFFGLPYLYKILIEWSVNDPVSYLDLRQSTYYSFFILMTLCFGVVMDIPWLIILLIRVRLLKPSTLASKRKFIYLGSAIMSAIMSPPDIFSLIMLFIPMIVLFELGLFIATICYGYNGEKLLKDND